MMKKMIVIMAVLLAFLTTTGCSVQLTTSDELDTKADLLVAKGEELQRELDSALVFVKQLDDKNTISSRDQKKLALQIEQIMGVINEFKELEVPVMGGEIKDIAAKNLKQREEILQEVQEKAEKGSIEKADLHKLEKAISAEFSIQFFN
jgi:outer membrane murein-binding lipoprotein Lpp